MKEILREYMKTTIISFALVVLINCIILPLNNQNFITITHVYQILFVCFIVNIAIFLIYFLDIKRQILKDILSIIVLITIVLLANYIIEPQLINFENIIINTIYLVIVYYGVIFILYSHERKHEKEINEILNSKRNQ